MHISTDQVLRTLEQIKSEVPSTYTYTDRVREVTGHERPPHGVCSNYFDVNGYTPACIVGDALARLGVHVTEDYQNHAIRGLFDYDGTAIPGVLREGDVSVDLVGIRMLRTAQYHQDLGHTWHTAIDNALHAALEPA